MTISKFFIIFCIFIILLSANVQAVNIEKGDRGIEVKKVQKLLAELGYNIKTDSIYGYRTREIVKDFQFNNGLSVDGIVGKNTYKLLKKTAEDIKYIIKKGDTLYDLAKEYDTTVEDIKQRNNINSNKIIIG